MTRKILYTSLLALLLSVSALSVAIPSVNAQEKATYAYIAVEPSPVGLNQMVYVSFWLQPMPPTANDAFHGFVVAITNPDGTSETRTMKSRPDGGNSIAFTPNKVGTYTFQLSYPGEFFKSVNKTYTSSTSKAAQLIVQQEPIQYWPSAPMPTGYWTRPISTELRSWSTISGNWLMCSYNATYRQFESASGFNAYSKAPRSAHIMYTKELAMGGLTGGEFDALGYYSGAVYDVYLTPPIVMNGRLIYNKYDPRTFPGVMCIDLRTGEELWQDSNYFASAGQLWYLDTPNQHGVIPLLWDMTKTKWDVYDPFNGEWLYSFNNAGLRITGKERGIPILYGQDGTMFVYLINTQRDWLAMWNSTKALASNSSLLNVVNRGEDYSVGTYRPIHGTYDWTKGIEWNVTIPDTKVSQAFQMISGNTLIYSGATYSLMEYIHVGYDLKTGAQLWSQNRSYAGYGDRWGGGPGIYVVHDTGISSWIAYDVKTGQELWKSDAQIPPWGTYSHGHPIIAYNKLYTGSYDGHLHAYDAANGKELWSYSSGESGYETPYGTWPVWGGIIVADGVVYTSTGEHSPSQPLYRGQQIMALDAETGKLVWNMSGHIIIRAIADGYLIAYNAYDNQLYIFGQGPSATTVTAPQTVISKGTAVMISGTVTDQSEGQKGTPAISDESMTPWMEYLHQQKPKPTSATGVSVKLSATNSNGDKLDIGTATTDINGKYAITWTPPTEGTYHITASFEGTNSYYGSEDTTYLSVGPAAAQPTAPEPTSTSTITIPPTTTTPQTTTFPSPTAVIQPTGNISTEAILIISAAVVIIVVVAIAAVLLRKRA